MSMLRDDTFIFKRSGIGDDLMVFWAVIAATMANIIPKGIKLFFERDETRLLFSKLAYIFPEIIIDESPQLDNVHYVRHAGGILSELSWLDFLSLNIKTLLNKSSTSIYEPYYHKWLTEYGLSFKPGLRFKFARATGLVKSWAPPYEGTYDGWQQLGIALGFSKEAVQNNEQKLCLSWPLIRERLIEINDTNKKPEKRYYPLFFPGGGSHQDFSDHTVGLIKKLIPKVTIARHSSDKRFADLYYNDLDELYNLIEGSELVITNDSTPSHLAQFLANKHILICTRSRPNNVVFPGFQNTKIIDLGYNMPCRPCAYYSLENKYCAAGFHRCHAQDNLNDEVGKKILSIIASE